MNDANESESESEGKSSIVAKCGKCLTLSLVMMMMYTKESYHRCAFEILSQPWQSEGNHIFSVFFERGMFLYFPFPLDLTLPLNFVSYISS